MNNLGLAYKKLQHPEKSRKILEMLTALHPLFPEGHYNLGNIHDSFDQNLKSIKSYRSALSLRADYDSALAQLLYQEFQICDWSGLAEYGDRVPGLGIEGSAIPAFSLFRLEDAPERHLVRTVKYTQETHSREGVSLPPAPVVKPEKLRVGYFSADFKYHATMFLMSGVFSCHDRERFEIFIYSYGPKKDKDVKDRLLEQVDKFSDVQDLSDPEIVRMARDDGLHIAIDLKGYTQHTRSGLFAHRLAPVQLNYVGYPGSMGADFIDYIVADETIIPEDCRDHYSEEIIYLPNSYQPNDNRRVISDNAMSRADFDLPEDGFVFCCFNNNYKITPAEFDVWSRLLNRFEESVLWLLRSNEWSEENLRREISVRGVDGSRLIFADKVSHTDHLARHRLADLFLDTFNVNAHTTASDALWGGLPVLTKMGRQFAARVAASLLRAVGLPELVVETEEAYEALACELVTNRPRLASIRERLAVNRMTYPLFDTPSYTRYLEDAYEQAYQLYFDGKKPETIHVEKKQIKNANTQKIKGKGCHAI